MLFIMLLYSMEHSISIKALIATWNIIKSRDDGYLVIIYRFKSRMLFRIIVDLLKKIVEWKEQNVKVQIEIVNNEKLKIKLNLDYSCMLILIYLSKTKEWLEWSEDL